MTRVLSLPVSVSRRLLVFQRYVRVRVCVIHAQSGTAEELEANLEMSSLVNYIQPARFHSFDYAESESVGRRVEFVSGLAKIVFFKLLFLGFNGVKLEFVCFF